jgi:hypothetical protein
MHFISLFNLTINIEIAFLIYIRNRKIGNADIARIIKFVRDFIYITYMKII